jgi:hypothetical protein
LRGPSPTGPRTKLPDSHERHRLAIQSGTARAGGGPQRAERDAGAAGGNGHRQDGAA